MDAANARESVDTRERILRAAMRVFAQHGLFKAPISMVAREAGVSKSLIFWYYRSRENLVREVVERVLPLDVVESCLTQGLRGRRLAECIARMYLEKYEDTTMRLLLLQVLAARGILKEVDEAFSKICEEMLPALAEGVWGTRSKENLVKARMLFGSLLCYTVNPPRGINRDEYVRIMLDVLAG